MADMNRMLAGLEPKVAIENEVVFFDSLKEAQMVSRESTMKMEYNAIIHCRTGRVQLEIGGNQRFQIGTGQLLLVPANKLMQPTMVSTDVDAGVLLVSERVLKMVLGRQIDIWNRAMYLHETYVIDTHRWSDALHSQERGIFMGGELKLFREFVLSFLRIFLLIICEELLRLQADLKTDGEPSSNRERSLFNQFLDLLHHEPQKRQQVNYYAERLCITPKYLSTLCRNVSGKSPMRWITDGVMEDCYQLLHNTNLTVKEISARLGFPNSSFFGQYFREQAGMTPLEYRNKYKNEF